MNIRISGKYLGKSKRAVLFFCRCSPVLVPLFLRSSLPSSPERSEKRRKNGLLSLSRSRAENIIAFVHIFTQMFKNGTGHYSWPGFVLRGNIFPCQESLTTGSPF